MCKYLENALENIYENYKSEEKLYNIVNRNQINSYIKYVSNQLVNIDDIF